MQSIIIYVKKIHTHTYVSTYRYVCVQIHVHMYTHMYVVLFCFDCCIKNHHSLP